jgi:hypothetical protein
LFGPDNAWAAETLLDLDARGFDAYHACATFLDSSSRLASNVAFARSFWLDIDAGPMKPYASWKDAYRALLKFTALVEMPQPLVVKSGVGIHAYFVTDADMPPPQWQPIAQLLKLACNAKGLLAGPERTADMASILRPAGTHHRKSEPRPVFVVATP